MKDRRFPARRVALRRWLGWVVATCGVGSLAFHHWVEIVLRVAPDRGGDGLEWVVGAALLGVGGVLALPARRPPAEADLPGEQGAHEAELMSRTPLAARTIGV